MFLWDIFCRVGGAQAGKATCMVTINSHDVVGDNFWLWRADHGRGAGWTSNPNKHGLIVNGDNVTLYGLFVEHTPGIPDGLEWQRRAGLFLPIRNALRSAQPGGLEAWRSQRLRLLQSGRHGHDHEAWGLGVYCVFYAAPVVAENAIETPTVPGVKMHHMVTIRLSGRPNSGINHVINGNGSP